MSGSWLSSYCSRGNLLTFSTERSLPQLLLGVFLIAASPVLALASLTVSPTVTPNAGLFTYSYSVANNTPDDPFVIDIPVPKGNAITSLMAPAGFISAYDSGLGLVSFLEDSSLFTSTPTSGFSFVSPTGPGSAMFAATTLSSSTFNLYTISGQTMAPVAATATPEPGYIGLLGLALCTVIGIKRFKFASSKSAR